jgi:hypothetical protein
MRKWSRALAAAVALLCLVAATASAMSRSDARALAQAANLKASDLPAGYKASPPDSSDDDPRADAQFAKCAGTVPKRKSLADVSSDQFELETDSFYIQVGSDVQVMGSAALVRKDLKAARTKRARKCFANALRKEVESQGTDVASVSVSLMKPGVRNGLGYRIKVVVRGNGVTVPVYVDLLAFGDGPVEAGVIVTSTPAPPVRSEEDQLLEIVSTRVSQQLNKDAIV